MMTAEFFRNRSSEQFEYVGTIYGADAQDMTGEEIADMIEQLDPTATMIDHPAHGGRNGFYRQSDNIHYVGHLVDECVFKAV